MEIIIPEEKKQDIIDAFCAVYGYNEAIVKSDGLLVNNEQTKAEFTKQQILSFIKDVYTSYKVTSLDQTKKQIISDALTFTESITVG